MPWCDLCFVFHVYGRNCIFIQTNVTPLIYEARKAWIEAGLGNDVEGFKAWIEAGLHTSEAYTQFIRGSIRYRLPDNVFIASTPEGSSSQFVSEERFADSVSITSTPEGSSLQFTSEERFADSVSIASTPERSSLQVASEEKPASRKNVSCLRAEAATFVPTASAPVREPSTSAIPSKPSEATRKQQKIEQAILMNKERRIGRSSLASLASNIVPQGNAYEHHQQHIDNRSSRAPICGQSSNSRAPAGQKAGRSMEQQRKVTLAQQEIEERLLMERENRASGRSLPGRSNFGQPRRGR